MRMIFLILLFGCAGDLEHPEQFSLNGDGGACDAPSTIFKAKCTQGACHSWTGQAGKLDLQSADVAGRYRDVAALCGGKLIDSAQPSSSVLLLRLGSSSCGGAMPPSGPLSDSERECVAAWIASVK
jgi:hypothetical protein